MKQFKGGDRPGKRVPFNRAKLLNIGNGLLSGIHQGISDSRTWKSGMIDGFEPHKAERQSLRKSIQQRWRFEFFLRNMVSQTELKKFGPWIDSRSNDNMYWQSGEPCFVAYDKFCMFLLFADHEQYFQRFRLILIVLHSWSISVVNGALWCSKALDR